MKRQLFYVLIMTALLGGCDSGDNSNEQTTQDNDTIIDNATIGKLQDKINNAVDGEVIDLTDFDMDDTEIVIDKRLTIKNGSLDKTHLKITSNDVTLQNIKSIKNIDSNASNLTIINSKISDLLLQSGSSRSSIDCNLIGSRVTSLTVNNMTNLLVANFDKNIDALTGTPHSLTAPANVARELGIAANSKMENSTLYDYYDTNTPAGENLIYTAKGWPKYVARYVSALYPDSFDFAADLATDEKINYYIEEESKAKNAFVNAGFENIKKARICKFYIAENDEENLSGYNAYREKLKAIDNVYSKFCFFDIANNDTIVSFDSDEDGIYYKADNWKKAVADYVTAFACSEDDAKMQLFGSTDDVEIEEDFGGDDSFVAIYPMDWQADDEAKWIEHVTETRCKLANLSREEIYRSDSYTWKNDESIFLIYVDEPCFYEKNEKFDADAYYYEIDLYSAIK